MSNEEETRKGGQTFAWTKNVEEISEIFSNTVLYLVNDCCDDAVINHN